MVRRVITRLSSLVRRKRLERELDKELQFHIDMLTEQNVRAGMAHDDARRAALRNFGALDGISLVLVGLAIGMAGALVLTRVLTTMLFGVQPTDAVTFLAVSMVLVAVAAAACIIPARRAASVDPMVALRVG